MRGYRKRNTKRNKYKRRGREMENREEYRMENSKDTKNHREEDKATVSLLKI